MYKRLFFSLNLIIIYVILSTLFFNITHNSSFKYFDSNFVLAIVTLLTGLVALGLYFKQKYDTKKDAANIIFLEVAHAEKILKQAKEGLEKGNLAENVLTTPAIQKPSWNEYRYLFVRDFDDKDWNAIEDFYNKCEEYNQAVKHNKSIFQKNEEQIRISLAKFLANYSQNNPIEMSKIDTSPEREKWNKLIQVTDNYQRMILQRSPLYIYKPQKPINDATLALNNTNLDILQATVIRKLKKIARLKE